MQPAWPHLAEQRPKNEAGARNHASGLGFVGEPHRSRQDDHDDLTGWEKVSAGKVLRAAMAGSRGVFVGSVGAPVQSKPATGPMIALTERGRRQP
jgi:hypothetical protein